jgi:hypothetical protein
MLQYRGEGEKKKGVGKRKRIRGGGRKMQSTQYKIPCISYTGYTGSIPYISILKLSAFIAKELS